MRVLRAQRRSIVISTIVCAAIATVHASPVAAQAVASIDLTRRLDFDIPAQPLSSALMQFSAQTGLDLSASTDLVEGKQASPLKGNYAADEALRVLLRGTGLEFTAAGGVIAIKAVGQSVAGMASPNTFRLAQADTARSGELSSQGQNVSSSADDDAGRTRIEEVIVTAQKQAERLVDVPVPVTLLRAESLVSSNQVRLQDYYSKVPGLSFTMGNRGEPYVAIRGITTGHTTNPTVGITVDDVPYGSSVGYGGGFAAADFDPGDLAHVEVLRGPQGALYGANSIGGLIKYVTVDPSTDGLSGRIEAGTSSVRNGDELGYNARGSINVPLGESFAIRASAFTRRDPGYIDNPITGVEGANHGEAQGGRLAALWRPSEYFSLKLSGLLQESERMGSPRVDLGMGDLRHSAPRNTGWYASKFEPFSAVIEAQAGSIDITSVTGYSTNEASASQQAGAINAVFEEIDSNKLTQELRLTGPLSDSATWLLGGFYARDRARTFQHMQALDPATGAPVDSLLVVNFPTTYNEHAAFANLTVKFTDRFDIQLGGRYSDNEQTYSRVATGPLAPTFYGRPAPVVTSKRRQSDNSLTYLVTPRFKVSDDVMVYARAASGYRPGSLNSGLIGVPFTYDADTTTNYELGVKGELLGRTLSFDVSVYSIDWEDIQIEVLPPGFSISFITNAGRAKSQGAEFSVQSAPVQGLTIVASGAWNEAELDEDFPSYTSVRGGAGERLPYSARWSGNLSINQKFPLGNVLTASAGAAVSYVGERKGDFVRGTGPRTTLPSYTQVDVSAGFGYESWELHLFLNNATDERGALSGDPRLSPNVIYTQPRTFGLSVVKTF